MEESSKTYVYFHYRYLHTYMSYHPTKEQAKLKEIWGLAVCLQVPGVSSKWWGWVDRGREGWRVAHRSNFLKKLNRPGRPN